MIVVTGGAGFIGSNMVKGLNAIGEKNILVVDDLTDGTKFKNIADCRIADYLDKDEFIKKIIERKNFNSSIKAIFHEGACSTTTEWNGQYMMQTNFEYSKILLHYCINFNIPFLYASSAAVYGNNIVFKETLENEAPINVYAYSKFLFDQYIRNILSNIRSQVVGFRYFNVYGPRESHKGNMASVAFHFNNQIIKDKVVCLFEGCDGYANGEQRRDFIYVEDVVKVKLWFYQQGNNADNNGIYNIGTGRSQTFNDVANAVIAWHQQGKIEYVPFPAHLKGHYQSFTEADISALRAIGYRESFKTVEEGVKLYLDWLNK